MVYTPLGVPAGTVKLEEPELGIPAVGERSVLCSSGTETGTETGVEVRTDKDGSLVQVACRTVAQRQSYGTRGRGSPGERG